MIKNFCILAFSLFTVCSFGQNILFEPNVNYDARELKQNLNKTEDSLILESEKIIKRVDILNYDFLKTIDFNSNLAKIDLSRLPIGDFVVQATIGNKRIVMYLEKREAINPFDVSLTRQEEEQPEIGLSLMEQLNGAFKKKKVLYWVVSESNGAFGSNKSMSLVYEDEVFRLIRKNKLEAKSKMGRKNTLNVYEVYDISEFMTKQFDDHKYYESTQSEYFNVEPLYSSTQLKE